MSKHDFLIDSQASNILPQNGQNTPPALQTKLTVPIQIESDSYNISRKKWDV